MEKDETKKRLLAKELDIAIQSVASYVERSDTLVILVPPTVHEDRFDPATCRKQFTCYRTWRRRGLCLLEMFACFFSRRKTHPMLLVRSEKRMPVWISSHESLKLAVGEAEFTCCERNHKGSSMSCVRPVAYNVMETLIHAKIKSLLNQDIVQGRWILVLKHFLTRGLVKKSPTSQTSVDEDSRVLHFKKILHWDPKLDGEWVDRENVSLLSYAACMDSIEDVRAVLKSSKRKLSEKQFVEFINVRLRKTGFLYVGIPGFCTAVIAAMVLGTPKTVETLLENGVDPHITDKNGNNPLMCACAYGRLENVKFWLDRFDDWELNLRGKFGNTALGNAIYMGKYA